MGSATSESKSSEQSDRVWHLVWALAGVVALVYGVVGLIAYVTQGHRHIMALPWFLTAAGGGLSMMSFAWRSRGD